MNGLVYEAVNPAVRAVVPADARTILVPADARTILDLGCGDGSLGRALKLTQTCSVVGVTSSTPEAEKARQNLDQVLVRDLESWDPAELAGPFDAIVCSHVLEHLRDPGRLLHQLIGIGRPGGLLIVAVPNVVHWRQRLKFLRGEFSYTRGGLMDSTHLRFYDWSSARAMLRNAGWSLVSASADGHFPLLWRVPWLGARLDQLACRVVPNLFGDQFILVGVHRGSSQGSV